MVKARKYILAKQFGVFPKPGDLKIVEEELPPVKDGEFLIEAVFLSVDPYMRGTGAYFPGDSIFPGQQVALIKESKNPDFPVGKYVVGSFGCRTHTVTNGKGLPEPAFPTWILPDYEGLPLSLALGALGMPGNTAYFAFLEKCQPKEGETVVVSGAAGAVGNLVGQIAKIKKCKVIGIAGSDEKLKWLQNDLGFDGVINYKTQNVGEALKKLAPQGVDCYFDNVAGEITATVLQQMNQYGRMVIAGAISAFGGAKPHGIGLETIVLQHELKMEGFLVNSKKWVERWTEGITQIQNWIKDGKLQYKETVTEGFDNFFDAFVDMLKGGNTGKAIVKV